MPKRPNPFGDSSPLQFKTRVRKKEVDLGVCREENMRLVYDRTRDLLFSGSKQLLHPKPSSCISQMQELDAQQVNRSEIHPRPQPTLKQVQFAVEPNHGACGMDCEEMGDPNNNAFSVLMSSRSSSRVGETKRILRANSAVQSFCVCQTCNRPCQMGVSHCSFCDKLTCANCIRQCHGCQGFYCHVCSVLNYDDSSERPFCLHCVT
ncbi:hypothetical protein CAPTEDRAFT_160692 [Capitella teleta]|uniref:Apoptosis regulatory protein Siva n=1 Tax=Capitella teleta TaxID=283909 RepID=R7VM06_CAPTE|nr:hypothetical protein CAPTEDRAFT_160692 [Capitella teleta]|eukprot:ELU18090.1 hypothetical protein CAPTEDRAFT_160692 [Capitella teleta]